MCASSHHCDASIAAGFCPHALPLQWFHFAVSNVKPGRVYKFNLVNFKKKASLFGAGKRPVVCLARPHGSSSSNSSHNNGSVHGSASGSSTSQSAVAQRQGGSNYGPGAGGAVPSSSSSSSAMSGSVDAAWQRAGANVAYYPSPYRGRPGPADKRMKKVGAAAMHDAFTWF